MSCGLFAAVTRVAHARDVVMEPAPLRLPGRFEVAFKRIGPEVDYHGKRTLSQHPGQSLPNI
ncbi:MAG: hypothetical protein GC183_15975 [Thiobacillus sp.]|nr:hypothetical protein [Thiobacillus sp.]